MVYTYYVKIELKTVRYGMRLNKARLFHPFVGGFFIA
jgi:hypothetical protein